MPPPAPSGSARSARARIGGSDRAPARPHPRDRGRPDRERAPRPREPHVTLPLEPTDEQRDELVEQVAREIQLRGLTTPAVHFLQASRPYRPLGANALLFFDP